MDEEKVTVQFTANARTLAPEGLRETYVLGQTVEMSRADADRWIALGKATEVAKPKGKVLTQEEAHEAAEAPPKEEGRKRGK